MQMPSVSQKHFLHSKSQPAIHEKLLGRTTASRINKHHGRYDMSANQGNNLWKRMKL
jgi:hypothetical protein